MYWLEIIKDTHLTNDKNIDTLIQEAKELTAIFAATDKTLKAKIKKK